MDILNLITNWIFVVIFNFKAKYFSKTVIGALLHKHNNIDINNAKDKFKQEKNTKAIVSEFKEEDSKIS